MSGTPRVTAVIVSFNTREHLLRSVASLEAHVTLPLIRPALLVAVIFVRGFPDLRGRDASPIPDTEPVGVIT